MGFIKKEVCFGILVSLFATICSFFIYLQHITESDLMSTYYQVKEGGVISTVIALAAIPNLFVFFIFLKKKQDYRARGVLVSTICIAFLTFVLKII